MCEVWLVLSGTINIDAAHAEYFQTLGKKNQRLQYYLLLLYTLTIQPFCQNTLVVEFSLLVTTLGGKALE